MYKITSVMERAFCCLFFLKKNKKERKKKRQCQFQLQQENTIIPTCQLDKLSFGLLLEIIKRSSTSRQYALPHGMDITRVNIPHLQYLK